MYVYIFLDSERRCRNCYWHSHTLQQLQQVWKVGRRRVREEEGRGWKEEDRRYREGRMKDMGHLIYIYIPV